jgi:hypothetical protein
MKHHERVQQSKAKQTISFAATSGSQVERLFQSSSEIVELKMENKRARSKFPIEYAKRGARNAHLLGAHDWAFDGKNTHTQTHYQKEEKKRVQAAPAALC